MIEIMLQISEIGIKAIPFLFNIYLKMIDIFADTLIDSIKLLPFLFVAYLIMEYIEHKISHKTEEKIKKSGKIGPLVGSLLGVFPQCGFSVAATNFYAARIITLGTLIAVYLSTSDEMLPILISEKVPIITIVQIIAIKFALGMIYGFIIDFILRLNNKKEKNKIIDLCEEEHCHYEKSIVKSAINHTVSIFLYIFLLTFIVNIVVTAIGEETLSSFMAKSKILEPVIASLIGLIPNCASSVIITELYLQQIIGFGSLIGGLLVNSGAGLLMLFRINKHLKENIKIVLLLYILGAVTGIVINFIGITI